MLRTSKTPLPPPAIAGRLGVAPQGVSIALAKANGRFQHSDDGWSLSE